MSNSHDDLSPGSWVARHLADRARDLTFEWIEYLRQRLSVRPAELLPSDALEDHVPDLIAAIAENLTSPGRSLGPEITEHLRLYASLRREQGYDVTEVVAEFGALRRLLSDECKDALLRFPGEPELTESMDLVARLHLTLAYVVQIVVGMFREGEAVERRELSRQLSEFARTVVHELRNPLDAATQSAHLLQGDDEWASDEEAALEGSLFRSLGRINDLLEDMLALADVESVQSGHPSWSLDEIVEEVFNQLGEVAARRDVRLAVEGPLPDTSVDCRRVELALRNLVLNAIKYSDSEKSERWVKVSASSITGNEKESNSIRISVADNGLGIPDSARDRIFQRHVRAHPTVADGTGIGLSITREILTRRGGRIWFETEEGEGTTFHIQIPAQPALRGGKAAEPRPGIPESEIDMV